VRVRRTGSIAWVAPLVEPPSLEELADIVSARRSLVCIGCAASAASRYGEAACQQSSGPASRSGPAVRSQSRAESGRRSGRAWRRRACCRRRGGSVLGDAACASMSTVLTAGCDLTNASASSAREIPRSSAMTRRRSTMSNLRCASGVEVSNSFTTRFARCVLTSWSRLTLPASQPFASGPQIRIAFRCVRATSSYRGSTCTPAARLRAGPHSRAVAVRIGQLQDASAPSSADHHEECPLLPRARPPR
jgi:hypothetical protein